jgi:hypothetical protein
MTQTEALKLALEALETSMYPQQKQLQAITAIKAALLSQSDGEAKDEPVAWAMLHDNGHFIDAIHPNEHARVEGEYITPLYTTPPQRKPLTDEEIDGMVEITDLSGAYYYDDLLALARAIEAKLRSKND